MSKTVLKGIAIATAVTIGAVTLVPASAEAGRRHHRHHKHNNGAAVAAAILGFAAAAAITSRPSYGYGYSAPAYTYAPPPPPRYYGPAYASYAPPVWSPEWYSYCASKWATFDPRDGTYQPYHGPRRLCH